MQKIRSGIKIKGIVQGVGFRPFVHKLVKQFLLTGFIRNTSDGVELEIEGEKADVDKFIGALSQNTPKHALIEDIEIYNFDAPFGYDDFLIKESDTAEKKNTLISPDIAICDDCLKELFYENDRRYRYPFINCTNCGPRFTIIKDIPYDRKNTTMAAFDMCPDCKEEYIDINNRRYHAQPDCCSVCGPEISYMEEVSLGNSGLSGKYDENHFQKSKKNEDAVSAAACALKSGKIVAIKGLGGFHLACRADDEGIVNELRNRKRRFEKPFAIMVRDISFAKRYCYVSEAEENALLSPARPIVLLEKKNKREHIYLSENNDLGVMLPYTPLHHLIFDEMNEDIPLIMTSANLFDEPIIYKNDETLLKLKGIADGILTNDRDIETRCDDSLIYVFDGDEYPVRRSRGYVPYPLKIRGGTKSIKLPAILACGAEQKASFALLKNGYIFMSRHTGDLKTAEVYEDYKHQIEHFETLFDINPEIFVCDLHPDYLSSDYAVKESGRDKNKRIFRVQHHHAHMASCMIDNELDEDCIGIIWDGTGMGSDGMIWGCEFLTGNLSRFFREGTLLPFGLPGGDKAVKEIWRVAVSLIFETLKSESFKFEEEKLSYENKSDKCHVEKNDDILLRECKDICDKFFPDEDTDTVINMLHADINCPKCVSMGRLFDAVSALSGIKTEVSYEGQGAVLLEAEAVRFLDEEQSRNKNEHRFDRGYDIQPKPLCGLFPYQVTEGDMLSFDFRPMIREIIKEKCGGGRTALKFMDTIVEMAIDMTKLISEKKNLNKVVLSGGSFQNRYILKRIITGLEASGFQVYHHRRVSTNDEGIAVGQAAVAMKRSKEEDKNVFGSAV